MLGQGLQDVLRREAEALSDRVRAAPSMLSYDERALLRWAARTTAAPDAAIVDAGAFLGGSALSLAEGLEARGDSTTRIHSYDVFRFDGEWEKQWVPEGFAFSVGGSSRAIVDHTLGDRGRYVETHAGDIREERWGGDDVGVLFIDITKSWSTADHVTRMFFPSLIPGTSLVIQQDQVHWGHPWCAIVMELLDASFEFLGWSWYSSAVYRCTGRVDLDALPASLLGDLSCDRKLELLERFAHRIEGPAAQSVRLSGAVVLAVHGSFEAARDRIDEVETLVSDAELPYISEGFAHLRQYVVDVAAGAEVS